MSTPHASPPGGTSAQPAPPAAEGDEVHRLLGQPGLARLLQLIRERLERQGASAGAWAISGRVRLREVTAEERAALQRLLGPLPFEDAKDIIVPLAWVDSALRTSPLRMGLVEALERLSGKLRDRPAERAAADTAWRDVFAHAATAPVIRAQPALAAWIDALRREGLVRRLAGGDAGAGAALLGQAIEVLSRLPLEGTRLAALAQDAAGDPRALERGAPLGTLVLRALALLAETDATTAADSWRELWSRQGAVCDDLTCDVLVAGLQPSGGTLAAMVRELAAAGEPVRLTLRQLERDPLRFDEGPGTVYVCENPVVVAAAADRLQERCPPLVCLDGMPNRAACTLLKALTSAGATLRYHGDFDWTGLRIANALATRFRFQPWAYTAADYERACAALGAGPPLVGAAVPATWDSELVPAMLTRGRCVFEEHVLDELITGLEQAAPSDGSGASQAPT